MFCGKQNDKNQRKRKYAVYEIISAYNDYRMYIQTIKNLLLFFGTLGFWLVLIAIEVLTGYSGVVLQVIYGLSMFSLFVAFWMVNRETVKNINNEFSQFLASGAIAMALMGLFVMSVAIVGSNFKKLIEGWL